jgi:hypothetical protein
VVWTWTKAFPDISNSLSIAFWERQKKIMKNKASQNNKKDKRIKKEIKNEKKVWKI